MLLARIVGKVGTKVRGWDVGAGPGTAGALCKGGAHMLANLRLACSRCNNVKSDRWLGVGRLRELKSIVLARSQGGVGR